MAAVNAAANVPLLGPRRPLSKTLLTALLTSGLAAIGIVVLVLLARRIAGALAQPLGGFSLVCVAALGLLLATLWRLGWQRRVDSTTRILAVSALPGIALFLLLCALSLPGTASWGLMLAWLGFFAGEATWWWTSYSALRPTRASISNRLPPTALVSVTDEEDSLPSNLIQRLTRTAAENGERVNVLVRVPFGKGQRLAVEHVAFCPPFVFTPNLTAEVQGEMEAAVSITSVHTFGIRLEVRLSEPAEEEWFVFVEVAGEAT